jgi:hypothetical protein
MEVARLRLRTNRTSTATLRLHGTGVTSVCCSNEKGTNAYEIVTVKDEDPSMKGLGYASATCAEVACAADTLQSVANLKARATSGLSIFGHTTGLGQYYR